MSPPSHWVSTYVGDSSHFISSWVKDEIMSTQHSPQRNLVDVVGEAHLAN